MGDLTGKTALVTGASRGIGRAIAQRLGADGALVAVHYANNHDAANQTIATIGQAGGQAFGIRCQLGVDGDLDTLFAGLAAGLGGAPLDILVNNAAILDLTPFEQVTAEAFDRSYAVNVRAPFFVIQRACRCCATVAASSTCRRRPSGSPPRLATTRWARAPSRCWATPWRRRWGHEPSP